MPYNKRELKILHLEDEPEYAEMFQLQINRIAKKDGSPTITFDTVASLNDGIALFKKYSYDCIITDYQLKNSNGLDALVKIKSMNKDIPVIFLTAQGNEVIAREAFIGGASDYFTKDVGLAGYERIYNSIHNHVTYSEGIKRNRALEAELRISEGIYRSIFENTGAATIIVEEDTTISLANNEFSKLIGMAREDIEGKISWTTFVAKKDLEKMRKYHHNRRINGKSAPIKYNFKFVDVDGNKKDIFLIVDLITGTKKSVASLLDMTKYNKQSKRTKRLLDLEKGLVNVSKIFSLPIHKINLDKVLKIIGETLGVDRSYIFLLQNNRNYIDNTNKWCAQGIKPQIDNLKGLETSQFRWWIKKLEQDKLVKICDVNALPKSASQEKEILQAQDIKSLLVVPINTTSGELIGFIGFDDTKNKRIWKDETIRILNIISEMISRYFERKQNILKIKESEKNFRHFTENIEEGVTVTDIEGKYIFVNSYFAQMLGYAPYEIMGRSVFDFIAEEFKDLVRDEIKKRPLGKGSNYELKHVSKSGTKVPVLLSSVPLFKNNGDFLETRTIVTDLTNTYKDQEAILKLNKEKNLILDTCTEGIAHLKNRKVIWANNGMSNIFGYDSNDLIGNDISLIHYSKESYEKIGKLCYDKIAKNGRWEGEFPCKHKNGEKICCIASAGIIDKDPYDIVAIYYDITKLKDTMEKLEKQRSELSQFAHTTSHDLKSPLQTIRGYAELLKEEADSPYVDNIIKKTDEVIEFINKSLVLADAGKTLGSTREVNLNNILDDIANSTIPKNIKFKRDALPTINCDPQRCKQIFQNLIINAVEHGKPKKIWVNYKKYEGHHTINVCDDGAGIPKDCLEDIFDIGHSNSKIGRGLGLTIVKKIVESHGGEISASGNEHKGTIFTIKIPEKAIVSL
ncbi:MAG: PAS domain S-box protein [Candidatus Methanofastidiosia archaeon]